MEMKQVIPDTPDYVKMNDLRERIMRRPLGRKLTTADTEGDRTAYLLGCFEGDDIKGCLVLLKHDDKWTKIRWVAVEEGMQGRGIGKAMLRHSYDIASGWGYSKMFCHARETALPFYTRAGWEAKGETFINEAGLPYRRMEYMLEKA